MNRLYMWESIILITSYLLCLMIEKKYMYTIVEGESGEKLRVMGGGGAGGGAVAAQRIIGLQLGITIFFRYISI